MKSFRWRILITLASVVLGLFALWPTVRYYGMSDQERKDTEPSELRALETQALRLGLDLRGGMHLVLELDESELDEDADTDDLMERALEVVRNRIDEFGVTEPVVQRAGEKRIIVELAGIQDPERALDIVSKAAVLEFQMVVKGSEMRALIQKLDQELSRLAGVLEPGEDSEEGAAEETDTEAAADSAQPVEPELMADSLLEAADSLLAGEEAPEIDMARYLAEDIETSGGRPLQSRIMSYPVSGGQGVPYELSRVAESNYALLDRYFALLDSVGAIPDDLEFAWEADPVTDETGTRIRGLYLLEKEPELTGEYLETASPQPDAERPGFYQVSFELDRRGARLFSRATGENVGGLMAIVLDGRVQSAPQIEGKIRGGSARITGRFSPEEAKDLAIVLKAGALPVPIKIEENRSVGPSLGRDSIRMGRTAIVYGFVAVLVFMLVYYRFSGIIAVIALLLNLVLMLAIMVRVLGAVLTLPGIAGFVLTIGMAVDANVLIFERIREELRNQQTFRNAVSRGYERAFRTIFDANVTTLITAIALLWFGTGPIQGFAVVLSVGIVVSMFTALFVTRLIFDLLTRPGGMRQVPI